jgi:hypothetical protein
VAADDILGFVAVARDVGQGRGVEGMDRFGEGAVGGGGLAGGGRLQIFILSRGGDMRRGPMEANDRGEPVATTATPQPLPASMRMGNSNKEGEKHAIYL